MITIYSGHTPNPSRLNIMVQAIKASNNNIKVEIVDDIEKIKHKEMEPSEVDLRVVHIDIRKKQLEVGSFSEKYQNVTLPLMEDTDGELVLYDSVTILQYLADKFNVLKPSHYYLGMDVQQKVTSLASNQGNLHTYLHYTEQKDLYSIKRFGASTRKIYQQLNDILQDRKFLADDNPTFVDAAALPWISCHKHAKIPEKEFNENYPHLKRWKDDLWKLDFVKKGMNLFEPYKETGDQESIETGRRLVARAMGLFLEEKNEKKNDDSASTSSLRRKTF